MIHIKLPVVGLSLVLLVAACNKKDFTDDRADAAASTVAATDADLSWTSPAMWENADQGTFSIRYFALQDSSITADVADNGLVLVYKRNGTAINALPFEEATATTTNSAQGDAEDAANANYWYHQVSEGTLLISCDVYTATDAANSFKYFVLTPQKLQRLQTAGYTTEKLMGLNYADAATLLKEAN